MYNWKTLSLLTADHGRSYYTHQDHRYPVTNMELSLENMLSLKRYYRGVIEGIRTGLAEDESVCLAYHTPARPIAIYGKLPGIITTQAAVGDVEVYQGDNLMITFTPEVAPKLNCTAHEALELLMPSLAALRLLCSSNGLVLIDHAQLLRHQYFKWQIHDTNARTLLYETTELYYEELIEDLSLITGEQTLHCEPTAHGTYQISARSSQAQHVLCHDIPNRRQADTLLQQLRQIRLDNATDSFRLKVISGHDELPFPGHDFHQKLTVLFPAWLADMNREECRRSITKKVHTTVPAQVLSNIQFAALDEIETILPPYRQWLEDIRLMNQLDFQHHFDNSAAFQVLKQLLEKTA